MSHRQRGQPAPDDLRKLLLDAIERDGPLIVASRLGLSRTTLDRCRYGGPVNRGTIAQLRLGLTPNEARVA